MADIIGLTETSATSMDIVTAIVQETLKEKSQFLPLVTDYSANAVKGAKSVKVPRRDQFAAADKTENTALTAQKMTFSVDTIDLDKHKAIFTSIEMIADLQATPNVVAEIVREMGDELALQIDKDIVAQLKLVSTSAPDHLLDYADSAGDKIARTDFGEAKKLMRLANVNMMDGNLFCSISPDQEKNMLDIDGFVEADRYGSREALLNGEIGRIFGYRIIVSNLLSAVDSIFWHKSHVGFALQQGASFKTDENLADVAQEFLLNQVYGVDVLDSGKRGVYFNGTGA